MGNGLLAWAGSSAAGVAAATAVGGPDYTGIALLISAVAGLISALTAMVIALRRKTATEDPTTVALLQQIADNLGDKP